MASLIPFLASSGHPAARFVRRTRRVVLNFTLPAPRAVFVALLATSLGLRYVSYFCMLKEIRSPSTAAGLVEAAAPPAKSA